MLAKEMSDTRNRGRIIWVFATSRPDLLEVDLKRQGRLDVHIPLFPPETPEERAGAAARASPRSSRSRSAPADLPRCSTTGCALGGNEIEGVLVRALRTRELAPSRSRPLKDVLADGAARRAAERRTPASSSTWTWWRSRNAPTSRFLPPRFRDLAPEEIEARIDELRRFV